MKSSILIIDDQDSLRHFLQRSLADEGHDVRAASNGTDGERLFGEHTPDLVFLDLRLPDSSGLELLERFKERAEEVPVVMMTAYGEIETAVQAMKQGAFDFLSKPVNLEEVKVVAEKALESARVIGELQHHRRKERETFSRTFVRGVSPQILKVYEVVDKVAESDSTSVLITGESGTGKQIIAGLIHSRSPRATGPFFELNCAAIPPELLESELFGHEAGAFTDARARKQGLLELASDGTLFLDEIGEMSLNLQVKLLKVLESMTFRRVGGTRDIQVNVRIVSATNQNLEQMVQRNDFREDLYYRLMVVPIRMPALRERRDDILLLARHFVDEFSKSFGKQFKGISPEAEARLLEYPWPGNVRELRNVFERTVLLEDGDQIEARQLRLGKPSQGQAAGTVLETLQRILVEGVVDDDGIAFEDLLRDVERGLIIRAAEASGWNQSKTAELLHVKRDKLRYRMKVHDLHESSVVPS